HPTLFVSHTACAKRFFSPPLLLRREKSGAAHSPTRFIRPRRRGRSNSRLARFFLAEAPNKHIVTKPILNSDERGVMSDE
ncbi:MAG: hypothetical protein KBS44_02235, partial [Clostridiales bacterium]|nr:hypothetical protein [Candidatus Coliplasma equi]